MTEPIPDSELRGRLLVATPSLLDPNFRETVVLILEHTDEGTFGLVLNRPSLMPVTEPLTAWEPLAAEPAVIHVGGPVEPDGVIGLARLRDESQIATWAPRIGDFPLVDLSVDPTLLADTVAEVRPFAGHSGWAAGQLEAEIAIGSWFVVDRVPGDEFTNEPETLWRRVLNRQGGVFSTVTTDPSAN